MDKLTFLYLLSCKRKISYPSSFTLHSKKENTPHTGKCTFIWWKWKKLYTYEYICIYFTVFASSGKPIDFSFAFQVGFYFIFFFWVKTVKIRDKRKKCRTATTVTSLSRRHMTCHFVSGWCVMLRATRKERPIMYMIAMLSLWRGFFCFFLCHAAYLVVIYTSGPTTSKQLIVH